MIRSWLPLPPCLASLSPFMISLLAAAAALFVKLVPLHDFAFGCRGYLVCEAPLLLVRPERSFSYLESMLAQFPR